MSSTTPPSTRSAAPEVAEACMEQTYTTIFATSSTVAARWITELGRFVITNAFASCSSDLPVLSISSFIIAAKPSDMVGPGSTLFTVTPLPATNFASPRASESWAVFVTP